MAFTEDFSRGLGTYIQTQSPALGLLDSVFGSDPNNAADINRDTTVSGQGISSNIAEQTTNTSQEQTGNTSQEQIGNTSQQQTGTSNVLTGSTALTDNTVNNTGLQTQMGTQGVGAFTGQTGLGMSGYDPVTGQFNAQLAQPYQQNANYALGASNQGYGALMGQDFNGTMGQRYNALEALQEQDRLRAQRAMEDRLYSQGRLGSTGGALQQNALLDAIAQQQGMNANSAFNQALAQRQQFGDQAMQFGQAALQPQQMSIQQLQAIGALAPQVSQNQIQTNNLSQQTGLQDTTGFQNALTSGSTDASTYGLTNASTYGLTNASSNTLSEQLAAEAAAKKEEIRSL